MSQRPRGGSRRRSQLTSRSPLGHRHLLGASVVLGALAALAPDASAREVALATAASSPTYATTQATPDPAAPSESAPPRRDAPQATARDDEGRGAPFEVGGLFGVGFPRLLGVEGFLTVDKVLLLGGEYSVLPKVSAGGVDVNLSAVSADARLFPFRGPLFVGARFGRQHLSASTTISYAGLGSLSEDMTIDSWFINPRVGFLWRWPPGLAIGFDVGLQIPIASSSSTSLPAAVASASANQVSSVTQMLGDQILPTVNLLEVGLAF